MDAITRKLVDLVCEAFEISREEFMQIVREEAEADGLSIKEELLV